MRKHVGKPIVFRELRVLIVDSSQEMVDLIRSILHTLRVPTRNISAALSPNKAFEVFCKQEIDIIIVDWFEDSTSGMEFTQRIRNDSKSPYISVPIVMAANFRDKTNVLKARDSGINEFLVKPFSADLLEKKLRRAMEKPREFIICDVYVGPERRVRFDEFMGDDKRDTFVLK